MASDSHITSGEPREQVAQKLRNYRKDLLPASFLVLGGVAFVGVAIWLLLQIGWVVSKADSLEPHIPTYIGVIILIAGGCSWFGGWILREYAAELIFTITQYLRTAKQLKNHAS